MQRRLRSRQERSAHWSPTIASLAAPHLPFPPHTSLLPQPGTATRAWPQIGGVWGGSLLRASNLGRATLASSCFHLPCTQDGDEDVALESAEFWVAFCDAEDLEPELLRPYLPRLIALLLDKMVFEEYDEEVQVRFTQGVVACRSGSRVMLFGAGS